MDTTDRVVLANNWLRRIWGVDNNNIFAIGDYGTIVYYDGVKWNKQKWYQLFPIRNMGR